MGGNTTKDNIQNTSRLQNNDDNSMYELDSQIMKVDDQSIHYKRNPMLIKD